MLQWFKENVSIRGIEPSENCAKVAENKSIPTDIDFFGVDYAKDWKVSFDLICGINVLAHQPDINDFVEGLRIALVPDGVITMEFPHLFRTI
jgi:2-polyprenyl-3-methyl-5-hydroxy-6-metoxy-1,4-benzoquinol methylase